LDVIGSNTALRAENRQTFVANSNCRSPFVAALKKISLMRLDVIFEVKN
jgi:hypothetical protein